MKFDLILSISFCAMSLHYHTVPLMSPNESESSYCISKGIDNKSSFDVVRTKALIDEFAAFSFSVAPGFSFVDVSAVRGRENSIMVENNNGLFCLFISCCSPCPNSIDMVLLFESNEDSHSCEDLLTVYCFPYKGCVFYSLVSADDAKFYAYESALDAENLSYEGFYRYFGEQPVNSSENPSECESSTSSSHPRTSNINVIGNVYWTDSNSNVHPLRNAKVDIHMGSHVLYAQTDSQGVYSYPIDPSVYYNTLSSTYYLCVYAKGGGVNVMNISSVTYATNLLSVSRTFDSLSMSLLFSSLTLSSSNCSSNLINSFSVHQAAELGARFATEMIGTPLNEIPIEFPTPSVGNNTTCYHGLEGTDKIDILYSDAHDWDVIMHEYGHYVALQIGIMGPLSYGSHAFEDCLNWTRGKTQGMQVAWSEGWATYFAISAQQYFNASAYGLDNVGDALYTDVESEYSIEGNVSSPILAHRQYGESQELSVASLLYGLTISSFFSDGYEEIWSVFLGDQPKTVSEFLNAFYQVIGYFNYIKNFGSLTAFLHIAASMNVSDDEIDLADFNGVISWAPQGGYVSFPNNLFTVNFYLETGQVLFSTGGLYSNSVALSTQQMNTIASAPGTKVYVCVKAWQTAQFVTGAYYSNYQTILL